MCWRNCSSVAFSSSRSRARLASSIASILLLFRKDAREHLALPLLGRAAFRIARSFDMGPVLIEDFVIFRKERLYCLTEQRGDY